MTLSPAAIAGLVVLGSAVAGVSIGFAVAAGLSDACVLNPQSCVVITFRRGPNNTLLVENGQYAYWFDGALIFAYGSKLPGVCPSIEALHATSTLLPVPGAPLIQNRCTRFAEDGKTCVEYANFCRKFSEEDPNTCLDCVTSTVCTADTPAANRVMDARRSADCAACLPQFKGLACSECAPGYVEPACDTCEKALHDPNNGCAWFPNADPATNACKPKYAGPTCFSCAPQANSALNCTECIKPEFQRDTDCAWLPRVMPTRWIACGHDGMMASSDSGLAWGAARATAYAAVAPAGYGGVWGAAGAGGVGMSVDNGSTWRRVEAVQGSAYTCVAYGGGYGWLAAGGGSTLAYGSPNGEVWSEMTDKDGPTDVVAVACDRSGTMLAACSSGKVWARGDAAGAVWTLTLTMEGACTGCVCMRSKFYVSSEAGIAVSTTYSLSWGQIREAGKMSFTALGADNNSGVVIAAKSDGTLMQVEPFVYEMSVPGSSGAPWAGVACDGGRWLAVGPQKLVAYSDNISNFYAHGVWQAVALPADTPEWRGLAVNPAACFSVWHGLGCTESFLTEFVYVFSGTDSAGNPMPDFRGTRVSKTPMTGGTAKYYKVRASLSFFPGAVRCLTFTSTGSDNVQVVVKDPPASCKRGSNVTDCAGVPLPVQSLMENGKLFPSWEFFVGASGGSTTLSIVNGDFDNGYYTLAFEKGVVDGAQTLSVDLGCAAALQDEATNCALVPHAKSGTECEPGFDVTARCASCLPHYTGAADCDACTEPWRDIGAGCAPFPNVDPATGTCKPHFAPLPRCEGCAANYRGAACDACSTAVRDFSAGCALYPHVLDDTGACAPGYTNGETPCSACVEAYLDPANNCRMFPNVDPVTKECKLGFSGPTCATFQLTMCLLSSLTVWGNTTFEIFEKRSSIINVPNLFEQQVFLRVSPTNFPGSLHFVVFNTRPDLMGTKVLQMPAEANPGWSTFFEFYALPPDSTTGWGYQLNQSGDNTSLVRDDTNPTFRAINVMSDVVEISGGQYYVSFFEFPQGKKIVTSGVTFWAYPAQNFGKKAVRVVQRQDGSLVVNGVSEPYDTTFYVLAVPAAATQVRLAAAGDAQACCSVCTTLDAAGRCTDCDAKAATKMDGVVFGKGAGMYVPTLTLDPKTLRVLGDGVNPATCARNLDSVKVMFSEFPPQKLKVRSPGGAAPDIFQIFGYLKTKGIYVAPK